MKLSFDKLRQGYQRFRHEYATGNASLMKQLAEHGQHPEIMVVACCDSRVDPTLILQSGPGDLFVVRNVANIVPPYEHDDKHHGTSAALEFAVCYLQVKHIIILGHSSCGGIHALLNQKGLQQNDFITNWVSLIENAKNETEIDAFAKKALSFSYQNCLSFPWIQARVTNNTLAIHRWFFDILSGKILVYDDTQDTFREL